MRAASGAFAPTQEDDMAFDIEGLIDELRECVDEQDYANRMADEFPEVVGILEALVQDHPDLQYLVPTLVKVHVALVKSFDQRGTVFICGNGGSFSDSLHIVGELLKSFERDRSLTDEQKAAFEGLPDGETLANNLEQGLRGYALGASGPLATAVMNDNQIRDINYAQELFAMARPGDVFIGISTSGNAKNVGYAAQVAKALGLVTIGMTGEKGGKLNDLCDIMIRVPATVTKLVQELHLPVYHAMCAMIEAHYFPKMRH